MQRERKKAEEEKQIEARCRNVCPKSPEEKEKCKSSSEYLKFREKCYRWDMNRCSHDEALKREAEDYCKNDCPKTFEEKKECASKPEHMELRRQCYEEEIKRKRHKRELKSKREDEIYKQSLERRFNSKVKRKPIQVSASDKKQQDISRDKRVREYLRKGLESKET